MELKKSPKASLEGKRPLLLLTGLVVALGFSLAAFEWRTPYDIDHITFPEPEIERIDIDDIPIIIEEEAKKEEIKEAEPPKPPTTDQLDIVPDETVVKETETEPEKPKISLEDLANSLITTPPLPEPKLEEEAPILFANEMPRFKCIKGDEEAANKLLAYVQKRINYPQRAVDYGVTGKVTARFVVDKTGKVRDVQILKGIGSGCDEEVIRVLNSLPDWCPGYHNGKYRDVYYTIPVYFSLAK